METTTKEQHAPFIPTGAVAFFLLLLAIMAVIWFTVYLTMVYWD